MIVDPETGVVGGGVGRRLLGVALAALALAVGGGAAAERWAQARCDEELIEVQEIELREAEDDAWLDASDDWDDDECDVDASEEPIEQLD